MPLPDGSVALAFDAELRRPACVLLAAALGGDIHAPNDFPTESWLVAPTDALRVYELDAETYARVVETVRQEGPW